ncbi:hypothetical protein H2198_006762 [Neophaeococcomyces mojaviensis]|uniref:Uncharacterized protein n=1 Tax=Neophaeococcomyces mojaviensis TaxID=3383035 RepID=A0ACC3A1Z2_9EURO|nr:hypothetical protein H2198_006762 [Knufia sp. JES_112]
MVDDFTTVLAAVRQIKKLEISIISQSVSLQNELWSLLLSLLKSLKLLLTENRRNETVIPRGTTQEDCLYPVRSDLVAAVNSLLSNLQQPLTPPAQQQPQLISASPQQQLIPPVQQHLVLPNRQHTFNPPAQQPQPVSANLQQQPIHPIQQPVRSNRQHTFNPPVQQPQPVFANPQQQPIHPIQQPVRSNEQQQSKPKRSRTVSLDRLLTHCQKSLECDYWKNPTTSDFDNTLHEPHFLTNVLNIIKKASSCQEEQTIGECRYAFSGCLWVYHRWKSFKGKKTARGGTTYRHFASSLGVDGKSPSFRETIRTGARFQQLDKLGLLFCTNLSLICRVTDQVFQNFISAVERGELDQKVQNFQALCYKFGNISTTAQKFNAEFNTMADSAIITGHRNKRQRRLHNQENHSGRSSLPLTCRDLLPQSNKKRLETEYFDRAYPFDNVVSDTNYDIHDFDNVFPNDGSDIHDFDNVFPNDGSDIHDFDNVFPNDGSDIHDFDNVFLNNGSDIHDFDNVFLNNWL